jgi:pimeloyl-ACP methyl ester carboxylesterase
VKAAWRDLPSWFVVAKNDEAIPPDAERQFAARMGATTIEVESGHLVMVTQSAAVIGLIEQAAEGVAGPA